MKSFLRSVLIIESQCWFLFFFLKRKIGDFLQRYLWVGWLTTQLVPIYISSLLPNQVGSFFMINLCLVVIATQFSETKQRENALMREQRARYMSNDSTLASYSEPGSCYEEMLRYISHLYRKLTRRVQRMYYGWHRCVTCCLNTRLLRNTTSLLNKLDFLCLCLPLLEQ